MNAAGSKKRLGIIGGLGPPVRDTMVVHTPHGRLRLRKRTSEPITAAHNDLFGRNVRFAI